MIRSALPKSFRRSAPRRLILILAFRYLVVLAALVFFSFPLFWITTMAVKLPGEYFASPPVWLPHAPHFDHFRALVRNQSIRALWNSLIIAGGSTVLSMVLGSAAAHSMARFKTGGRHLAMWFLSQRMLPPIAIAFPVFLLYRSLGWVDTHHGLILLYTVFNLPYVVWMMRSYFEDIPVEIEESALVDGCSRWRVLWSITLPLSAGGLMATAVFAFIFAWNEFLFALILTRTNAITMPLALAGYFGPQSAFWGEVGALSMLSFLPIFAMTLAIQRYLVRGLTLGAVK